jgi:CubicO group peptidase (beta-lactamase class C family)/endonuclease YncB( thermonuclease family)
LEVCLEIHSKFHSQSVAKTLIGYVAGHAICKGYIDSVDSRLNDWPILENTLYHNQKLIDVLNMASGTQAYFNGSNRFTNSNRAVTSPTVEDIMKRELKGSKKSSSIYNYNNLNPNVVGSYLIYKLGADNFQALLDDVFKNKARIEGEAFFLKNEFAEKDDLSMWSQFYATRYDYLRIAKAMLDDWENDTCAGQYLKTIHERRINKGNWGGKPGTRVSLPEAYAGFFHTGYLGMANRPVMGMDGYGGQTILIDFERGRIIATQSIHDNMKFPQPGGIDFKKISYERIKNGKPSSKVKPPPEPNVDSQQILKERNAAIETEKKGKRYWDDYYDCKETIEGKSNIASCMDKKLKRREKVEKLKSSSGGSILLFEDFENLDERELLTDDREDQWYVKKDNDDNSMYCNKKDINDDYAGFNLGSKNWRDYSISYRMKFATGKGGELETHIRKNNNRQGEYRSVINSKTGNTYLKYVKGADKINVKIANGSRAPIRDKWADIQLIASGKTIVYIVNGIVVASIEDDRLKKGALMFAVTSKSELCLDDIVIKKEGTQEETPAYQNIAKAQSEGSELFKDIKTSNTFDGYYGFTNMMPPSTSLGNGTLEINNGILTISQGRGDLTPKYESFEGRIDQNGDIKANFYFAPCRSCGLEDKFIVFEGNINKKKLSGKYNDSQIYFYLTGKKGDVIKEEKTEKEIIEIIELNTENTQTIEIAIPKNSRTWDYPFLIFDNYEANGSNDYYKFQSNLKEDEDVLKNLENNHQTGLISYLLFENNKIVIDESDIPVKVQGDRIINGLLPSHSMGKSLVSYVTGHAICEGYIESVDERLSGWDVIENTLYEDQILIDLLNMSAGDQEYIGERLDPQVDNLLKKSNVNSNLIPLKRIMELDLLNSKKSKPLYNYSALTTNVILNYVIHKTDDDWQKLLNKVFNEHVKVKNSVYFSKTPKVGRYEELVGYEQTGRYSFYATRYDYLRIAKTMMEDWKNETCAGKYLKTIYDRRIEKADDIKISDSVGLYTQKYGGQFHFDIYGFKKGRKIIGMDGFAGQQILIDLDNEKIIVVNSLLKKYDWKKIVYERIKNGKPASTSLVEETLEPVIDPEQLILENKIRRENEKKAKAYWDDYYIKVFNGGSDVVVFGSSTIGDDEVVSQNPYADETTTVGTKVKETKAKETRVVETLDTDPTISEVIEVSNADKFIVNIAEPHELAGTNIKIGLKDIDAPDAIKSCPKQMEFGIEVRDYVSQKLENASSIKLTNYRKTNTKIIAEVIVDGVDLGDELVSKGYASREFGFWKPYFCNRI